MANVGGEGGIRTLGRGKPTHAFQACAFNRSATSPARQKSSEQWLPWLKIIYLDNFSIASTVKGYSNKKGREHVRLFDVGPDQNLSVFYFSFIRHKFQG
jgi:hypothetical protein